MRRAVLGGVAGGVLLAVAAGCTDDPGFASCEGNVSIVAFNDASQSYRLTAIYNTQGGEPCEASAVLAVQGGGQSLGDHDLRPDATVTFRTRDPGTDALVSAQACTVTNRVTNPQTAFVWIFVGEGGGMTCSCALGDDTACQ